ncbi:MAG: helix-turn-helix transcriptional regulator [Planctomycetes bacterium]|nr:helix-turn-helix transcriptional regulator [Planctomycetota bacterium]
MPRRTSEDRKDQILDAVQRVFAESGFHATTTKHLAEAAGVSEALLFKYFPTKERLYSEMLTRVCAHCAKDREQWLQLPPNTATLAILVHHVVKNLAGGPRPDDTGSHLKVQNNRLMLQSLLADGAFARKFLSLMSTSVVDALARCLIAAAKGGDCDSAPGSLAEARVRSWSALHVAMSAMMYRLPEVPAIDYQVSDRQLIPRMVRFSLRGLGLSQAAIDRCYQPDAMAVAGT